MCRYDLTANLNINRMAIQSGFQTGQGSYWLNVSGTDENLRRFAVLVIEEYIKGQNHVKSTQHTSPSNQTNQSYGDVLLPKVLQEPWNEF